VAVPAATPVTTPEALTVAVARGRILHVPPAGVSPRLVVEPTHTVVVPVIAVGVAFTVTGVVTKQPVGSAKVILVVPAATPVTIPVDAPTVAVLGFWLVHVLVPDTSLNVVVANWQTVVVPVITDGSGLTVISVVT